MSGIVALQTPASLPVQGCPYASMHWATISDPYKRTVDVYTPLIPEDDARAVVAELQAASAPMGIEHAKTQAKLLIGSYPHPSIDEPEIYSRAIVSVLAEVPPDIGRHAIDRLTRTLRFLPTRAEVDEMCGNLVAQRKLAAWVAEKHITEHARRRDEIEREKTLGRERTENKEAVAAWMEIPALERPPLEEFVDGFTGNRWEIGGK